MIRFTPAIATIAALPLVACMQPPVENMPGPGPGAGRQCNASGLEIVGRAATPQLTRQAMRRSGSRTVRVIRPGMAVTMDYRTDRLNIEVNERNIVTVARCG